MKQTQLVRQRAVDREELQETAIIQSGCSRDKRDTYSLQCYQGSLI